MEAATFKVRDCNSWHWIQSSSAYNGAEKDDKIFGQILFGGCGGETGLDADRLSIWAAS